MSLDLLPELYILNKNKCEICIQTKRCKKSFKSIERSTKLLDLIHNDICQLNSIMTHSGKRYFITFIDDFSKYCHIYQIRSKDEAFQRFAALKNKVENQLNLKIKVLRSDQDGEYTLNEFSSYCENNDIIHEITAPYAPQ